MEDLPASQVLTSVASVASVASGEEECRESIYDHGPTYVGETGASGSKFPRIGLSALSTSLVAMGGAKDGLKPKLATIPHSENIKRLLISRRSRTDKQTEAVVQSVQARNAYLQPDATASRHALNPDYLTEAVAVSCVLRAASGNTEVFETPVTHPTTGVRLTFGDTIMYAEDVATAMGVFARKLPFEANQAQVRIRSTDPPSTPAHNNTSGSNANGRGADDDEVRTPGCLTSVVVLRLRDAHGKVAVVRAGGLLYRLLACRAIVDLREIAGAAGKARKGGAAGESDYDSQLAEEIGRVLTTLDADSQLTVLVTELCRLWNTNNKAKAKNATANKGYTPSSPEIAATLLSIVRLAAPDASPPVHDAKALRRLLAAAEHSLELDKGAVTKTASQTLVYETSLPFFFKMAQNLDLRSVLLSTLVVGANHVSIRPRL